MSSPGINYAFKCSQDWLSATGIRNICAKTELGQLVISVTHVVPFIVFPIVATLPHREPALAGTYRDACSVYRNVRSDTVFTCLQAVAEVFVEVICGQDPLQL